MKWSAGVMVNVEKASVTPVLHYSKRIITVGAAFQPRFRQGPLKQPGDDQQKPQGNIGENPGEDIVQHYAPPPV